MAATLVLGVAVGCMPAGSDDAPERPGAPVLQIVNAGENTRYEVDIIVPDPCYRVRDDARVDRRDDVLRITRTLAREPGICATVLTTVRVEGVVGAIPDGVSRVALRLINPAGDVVSTYGSEVID